MHGAEGHKRHIAQNFDLVFQGARNLYYWFGKQALLGKYIPIVGQLGPSQFGKSVSTLMQHLSFIIYLCNLRYVCRLSVRRKMRTMQCNHTRFWCFSGLSRENFPIHPCNACDGSDSSMQPNPFDQKERKVRHSRNDVGEWGESPISTRSAGKLGTSVFKHFFSNRDPDANALIILS